MVEDNFFCGSEYFDNEQLEEGVIHYFFADIFQIIFTWELQHNI